MPGATSSGGSRSVRGQNVPDLRAYARTAAVAAGADPDLFERQIQQESGFNPDAFNAGSGATGVAQIVSKFHPDVDPHDPIASLDYAARWMARLHEQYGSYRKALVAYNYGPGNLDGADGLHDGVINWDGRRDALPAETAHYLDVILGPGWPEPGAPPTKEPVMAANDAYRVADGPARLRSSPGTGSTIVRELPVGTTLVDVGDPLVDADGHQWRRVALAGPVGYIADELLQSGGTGSADPVQGRYTFNPTTPTELQRQPWTCSIRSVMWLLKSIGISVTPDEAQDAMAPIYVNSDVGLKEASGAGVVEVLRDRWGVHAVNFPSLSFDEALSLAGTGPLAIGLRRWGGDQKGHWSAVRGRDGLDRLVLANPGGTGPIYGQQTLNRQQFDARGPASGVFIPVA